MAVNPVMVLSAQYFAATSVRVVILSVKYFGLLFQLGLLHKIRILLAAISLRVEVLSDQYFGASSVTIVVLIFCFMAVIPVGVVIFRSLFLPPISVRVVELSARFFGGHFIYDCLNSCAIL